MSDCICMNPVFRYPGFDRIEIGVDETKGRFGEVSILVWNVRSKMAPLPCHCGSMKIETLDMSEHITRKGDGSCLN